ncbi:MAG TPA: peptidylprolyl isomerase [Thermoanaerobaculia bacterium]|nr:peptidylprolyl isomerase [Thermoanaerobaculia bacterium]
MRTFRRHALVVLVAAVALAGCLTFGAEKGPPKGTYRERLIGFARLLRMEDRKEYDPLLAGRTAASPDSWLRAKTALAVSRLKDPDAAVYLPVLLKDAEAFVRRAATFGAGLSGDARLLRFLVAALGDSDAETAANAAEALGKIGGKDATDALLGALAKPAGPRPACALALFRKPEARTVTALLGAFGEENLAPDLRRAIVYSLSRKPQPEAAPALRAVVRRGNENPDVPSNEEVAWAARGLGLLEDEESTGDLIRLAASRDISVSVQALGALDSLSKKSAIFRSEDLTRRALAVAVARANDALPGVAVAALRLLGSLPESAEARAVLEENLLRKGWRGQTALVSLVRLDAARAPEAAAKRLDAASASDSLELRLGAAQALEFLGGESALKERVAAALHSDRAARIRAAVLSSLSKQNSPKRSAYLLAGLIDRDAAVRDVALDAAAPLLEKGSADLKRAWSAAFDRAFESGEPDFTVGALDAAVARGEAGRALVAAHANDADAVTREKARRLLVEKYGATVGSFRPIPVATRLSTEDYERVARAANESFLEAEIATARGSFRIQLLAEDAPLTVESFRALAGRRFFDGMAIHRVVPDFVVQTGDPRGDGSGGPGYAIRDEINPNRYARGAVGMALSGADTGGSQWFVALSPQLHLDGGYAVFGRVLDGWDVLDRIEQDDPLVSVRVTSRPREGRPPGAAP